MHPAIYEIRTSLIGSRMRENHILYTKPLLSTHSLCNCVNKATCKSGSKNKCKSVRYKKIYNRDYVGKYCLVDWLDDNAIIDCSLIHDWD